MSWSFLLDSEPLSDADMPTTYGIEIQFIESSNGNPQQHAREHRLFVKNTQWEKPYIGMETVGEILVFIL